MNTFGNKLRLTTFGESHGRAIGGVIDGFPPCFKIDFNNIYSELAARRPGSTDKVSKRKEPDHPEFLSGINEEGYTLGTPIAFIIKNTDNRDGDYSELSDKYRPNHADFTYDSKYGIRDYKGGGRASARETANWVVAGALAGQWLKSKGIEIETVLSSVGKISFTSQLTDLLSIEPFNNERLEIPIDIKNKLDDEIINAKNSGDSIGGTVSCLIKGLPSGIGEPIADKLHARLAFVMMSINAAKGFEYGIGMNASQKKGSEILDIFEVTPDKTKVITRTNYSGGIQGGISNGMPIFFNVAFKPTPTIMKEIATITKDGLPTQLKMKGRHDPCVAVRAVPIVKAMAALVICDFML